MYRKVWSAKRVTCVINFMDTILLDPRTTLFRQQTFDFVTGTFALSIIISGESGSAGSAWVGIDGYACSSGFTSSRLASTLSSRIMGLLTKLDYASTAYLTRFLRKILPVAP